jgi:tetratricopeptide (TPR) repeat protein
MAERFGTDEVRARALNIMGVSSVKLGDRRGLADIERCLEITAGSGSPERIRGFINLASTLGELGELRRSIELHEEGLHEAERIGTSEQVRWLRAECLWDEHLIGRWHEAAAHADEFLAEVEAGHPHYMEAPVREARAMIRLARGDGAGALDDTDGLLALTRAAEDPQLLFPSLAYRSRVLLATGRGADAVPLVDELLERLRSSRSSLVSYWAMPFAVVLTALGRPSELETVAQNATISHRWLDAARAYAARAFEEAADILADMGAIPDEAFVRLRAAEALVDAGRRAEADAQVQRALAFYRSVGATAYVREGESLFAASA